MPQLGKLINIKNRLRNNSLAFESLVAYDSFETYLCCCSKPLKCNYNKITYEYALSLPSPKTVHFTVDHILRNFQMFFQTILLVLYGVVGQRFGWWHFKLPVKVPIHWGMCTVSPFMGWFVCKSRLVSDWLLMGQSLARKQNACCTKSSINGFHSFQSPARIERLPD